MCFIPGILVPIIATDIIITALQKNDDTLEKRIQEFYRQKILPRMQDRMLGSQVFTVTVPFFARKEGTLIKDSELDQLIINLRSRIGFMNVSYLHNNTNETFPERYELKFDFDPIVYTRFRRPYARL